MRVLLIEDDVSVYLSLEKALRDQDMCVDTADRGEDGIEFARRFDYDAIILDLRLPDISGFEVLRTLRLARIETPVIIVSGLADIASKVKGAGCRGR
jgi:two-component system cell cycle response regulator CtrA